MVTLADDGQVLQVALFLDPRSASYVRATSKTGIFAKVAGSDAFWSALLLRAFGLLGEAASVGPSGEVVASPRESFSLWHGAARAVDLQEACSRPAPRPLPARWVAVWSRLRRWLQANAPAQVTQGLRPPVREEVLDRLQALGYPANPLVTDLWSVHNGQSVPSEILRALMRPAEDEENDASKWDGLFGGYSVYHHLVCTVLLPLEVALSLTATLKAQVQVIMDEHPTKLAFACSPEFTKILLVDVQDGTVYVWTKRMQPSVARAVPPGGKPLAAGAAREGVQVRLSGLRARPELNGRCGVLTTFDADKGRWEVVLEEGCGTHLLKQENLFTVGDSSGEPAVADGLLRWFDEYVRRVEEGVYTRQPLKPEWPMQSRGFCLFPAKGPDLSRCVTRGVEVTASCVYMPEHQQGWGYSIAFRIVGSQAECGFETCQLHTRTWEIQEDGQQPEHINGEGVIGLFPILKEGGWICNRESDPHHQYDSEGFHDGEFRYQSCTGRFASMRGSFGGRLTFVPGTIKKPTGRPFDVRLEPFRLYVPEYIF